MRRSFSDEVPLQDLGPDQRVLFTSSVSLFALRLLYFTLFRMISSFAGFVRPGESSCGGSLGVQVVDRSRITLPGQIVAVFAHSAVAKRSTAWARSRVQALEDASDDQRGG